MTFPARAALEQEAERQLAGVGDAAAGEWREWTGFAFHLRRRLSGREAHLVGPVVDIRHSPEAAERAERLGPLLAMVPPEWLAAEVGPSPAT